MLYNDYSLDFVTMPAGSGSSFLGYLTEFYLDNKPRLTASDYPVLNKWDRNMGVGMPDFSKCGGNILNHTILAEYSQGSARDNAETMARSFYSFCTELMANKTASQSQLTAFAHIFPIEYKLDGVFGQLGQLFTIQCDEEMMLYVTQLKKMKSSAEHEGWRNMDVVAKSSIAYEHQQLATKYPILNTLDYRKFFIDINTNEIEKYFTFIENKEFNNDKLEPVCDMIEAYTKLNKELLNA